MAKYEAVDRLMDLAMEKRADRGPGGTLTEPDPSLSTSPVSSGQASSGQVRAGQALAVAGKGSIARDEPSAASAGQADLAVQAGPSSADRGRQILHALRPFLPAVAGAMRLVDHGAVQALARLLPLLGGSAPSQPTAQQDEAREQWLRSAAEVQAAQQTTRKELQALTLQVASLEERLGRSRGQLDRLVAEQATRDTEVGGLADRVRLLSAGVVILVILMVAQVILFVVMFYK